MNDDRGQRHSLLEAQSSSKSSVASPVRNDGLDSLHREPRHEGQEIRTFDEDSDSGEDVRHDQRADLARMMSRRNFAVGVDGIPLAAAHRGKASLHRVRASSGTAAAAAADAAATAPEATAYHHDGAYNISVENNQGQPRPSTVGSAASVETSEPAEEERQSHQVVDFFRTVNKDAHLLKKLSSNKVQGFGGHVVRVFASCLRRVGVGNPGASVERMAFGTDDPLDFSTSVAARPRAGSGASAALGRGASVRDCGDLMDEDLEEEEEADEEELSAQKKKVHDLGELPALNWSNASVKLLVTAVVIGILLFTLYSGLVDTCLELGQFCLREWLNGLCVAVAAYFVIELLAKTLAGFFKWTRLLHTNNKVWIFIKLHKNVSLLIWSILIFSLWTWFETTNLAPDVQGVIRKILGIFLAYTATDVVSEVCKVEMAHRYMWRPYLERARASIWSQYVIFMMTDYAMGLKTKDEEGQALALGFTKTKKGGEHLSLYTVGKAIGFVHANALRHPLGPGRPGTDRDGMIDSKTGARLFGGLLFDALMITFNEEDASKLLPISGTVSISLENETAIIEAKSMAVDAAGLPRPFSGHRQALTARRGSSTARPVGAGTEQGGIKGGPKSPKTHRTLSSVPEASAEDEQQPELDDNKEEGKEADDEHDDGDGDGDDEAEAEDGRTSTGKPDKWSAGDATTTSATATAATAAATTGAEAALASTAEDVEKRAAGRGHKRSGGERGSTASRGGGSGGGGGGGRSGHRGINLVHLRKMTSKPIALKMMELFEVPPDGVVTRKEFVDRIMDIFVQRRSLQLTLADYEAILNKVGYLISAISAIVVAFIGLRILGYNIGNLVLTWLSLAVAFSFLFGSSASAFFESIIFVFVTKAYDVGDPVFFVDDTGGEDWYIVTRINMLTTVFRRWDGQATLVANNLMAKKAIRNQWRSSAYLHHTMLAVSVETPMEKLDLMKAGVAAGMRRGRHHKRHGHGGMLPDTVDYQVKGLTDGNRLSVFVLCRQRENSANMGRRFGNSSLFLKLIVRECNRHGISYTLPAQPFTLGGAGDPLDARETFLGGKAGDGQGSR